MKKKLLILTACLFLSCSIEKKNDLPIPQDGQQGQSGTDGVNGQNGSDGQNGSSGVDGANCFDQIGDWNNDGVIDSNDCIAFKEYPYRFVQNSDHCQTRKQYAFYINGYHFSNVNMQFKQKDSIAILCGDIKPHGYSSLYSVWVEFKKGKEDAYKEPLCKKEYSTDDWVQYTEFHGTIIKDDGSVIYEIERKGEAFQVGKDAQVTERKTGVHGASGWFKGNCTGDINFILKN